MVIEGGKEEEDEDEVDVVVVAMDDSCIQETGQEEVTHPQPYLLYHMYLLRLVYLLYLSTQE